MTGIHEVLEERGNIHGDFSLDAATAQRLKYIIHHSPNYEGMEAYQKESLELICTKLARICVGNAYHPDHWLDISGYATLVHDRLVKEENDGT